MDFVPTDQRAMIKRIARKHKEDAISLQRSFARRPDRYIPALKNKRILDEVKEWEQEDRAEERERDR